MRLHGLKSAKVDKNALQKRLFNHDNDLRGYGGGIERYFRGVMPFFPSMASCPIPVSSLFFSVIYLLITSKLKVA